MLAVYGALILLPLLALARGELKSYQPLEMVAPTVSIFYCFNVFSKLAVGALSGFEYVAILAGETRSPARDIGRSVLIASPIIALMFILGTSSVLAFIGDNPIDLIGPVPQTLRLGLHSFPIAGAIASIGILLMMIRSISATSVHLTGSSRLPMVAGWDGLLPGWFSRLHPRYKTPVNSIIFVGAITLVISITSQIGAGIQEAFQLVDNAAIVFYGIVYLMLFAIPLVGAKLGSFRRARSGCEWPRSLARRVLAGDFFHGLSDHRRPEPADVRSENCIRYNRCECRRYRHLPRGRKKAPPKSGSAHLRAGDCFVPAGLGRWDGDGAQR